MSNNKQEFIGSTIGMMAYHSNMSNAKLVRVQYYRIKDGIQLRAVSGHNLERLKVIPAVIISEDTYKNRDLDTYNDQIELFWALTLLDFEISEEE